MLHFLVLAAFFCVRVVLFVLTDLWPGYSGAAAAVRLCVETVCPSSRKGAGRGGGKGGLCTTSAPEGLNKCIKINTNDRGAAFPKVTVSARQKEKIF